MYAVHTNLIRPRLKSMYFRYIHKHLMVSGIIFGQKINGLGNDLELNHNNLVLIIFPCFIF